MADKFRNDVLVKLMRDNGIRQSKLAYEIGVNRSAVKRWCDGKCIPTYANAQKIACVLGVKASDLFDDVDDEKLVNKYREMSYLQIVMEVQKRVNTWNKDQRMFLINMLVK